MHKLRILLVDDHAMLREGLQAVIDSQPDMQVIGQAGDSRAAIEQALDRGPDIVVMDIGLPGVNGMQVAENLRATCPGSAIVALTRHREPAYLRQMMLAGAHGYVLKQSGATTLLDAIRVVAGGANYLDPMLAGQIVHNMVSTAVQSGFQEQELSDREADVVRLIAHGYTNKEIAAQLDISVKTVETYKTRAMEKLGLHGRAALVRYALERGWLRSDG